MLRTSYHKRRVDQRAGGGHFTPVQFRELCGYYGYVCLCCGASGKLTADHVVPLSRGGTNTIDNIQPLCLKCNIKKGMSIFDYRKTAVRRVIQHSFF